MKDALGQDLRPGDLIADIRTGYQWSNLGIVHGGITNGGRIRYVSMYGYKNNSQEKCLIKITPETFFNVKQRKLIELIARREQANDLNNEWYDKKIKEMEKATETIREMRHNYGQEF